MAVRRHDFLARSVARSNVMSRLLWGRGCYTTRRPIEGTVDGRTTVKDLASTALMCTSLVKVQRVLLRKSLLQMCIAPISDTAVQIPDTLAIIRQHWHH